jgi:hypothetical protein
MPANGWNRWTRRLRSPPVLASCRPTRVIHRYRHWPNVLAKRRRWRLIHCAKRNDLDPESLLVFSMAAGHSRVPTIAPASWMVSHACGVNSLRSASSNCYGPTSRHHSTTLARVLAWGDRGPPIEFLALAQHVPDLVKAKLYEHDAIFRQVRTTSQVARESRAMMDRHQGK